MKRTGVQIAVGLLAFAVLMAGMILIGRDRLALQQAELSALERRLDALELRLQTREELLAEIRVLDLDNPSGSLLLTGSTAALAGAQLQGLVNGIVEGAGSQVRSIAIVEPDPVPPFLEIGIQADILSDMTALRDILVALEQVMPVVIVRRLTAGVDGFDDPDPILDVFLEVRGFAAVPES